MSYRDEREALRAEKRRLEEELDETRERLEEIEHQEPTPAVRYQQRVRKTRLRYLVIGLVFAALIASGVLFRVRPMGPLYVVFLFVVLIGSIAYVRYVFLRCPECERPVSDTKAKSCPSCGVPLAPHEA